MIPNHIAKSLIFYMTLAKTNHDSNVEFLKNSTDMHKYIQDEIKELIDWLELEFKTSQPIPELKIKGHVLKSPPPSPVFNKKD